MNSVLFSLIGLLVVGIGLLAYAYYRLNSQYDSLSTVFHSKSADLGALCSAALIQDQRIYALEQQLLEVMAPVVEKDESEDELPESDGHGYQAAIEGIKKGVNAQQLVDDWGMSRDEADLLIRLHGISLDSSNKT